ncbi:hypothetical protein [Neorhizobium sp. DAR64860/K0K1]|uniref:hypothetical protein n=1 Tax=Neorhizobium sp. DAR64860/K0K1 TaxID=3421955 RepID=UPI003D2C145E
MRNAFFFKDHVIRLHSAGKASAPRKSFPRIARDGIAPHTEDCHLPDNTGRFIDMARMQLYNTSFALHYAEWSARFWFQTIRPDGIDCEN